MKEAGGGGGRIHKVERHDVTDVILVWGSD